MLATVSPFLRPDSESNSVDVRVVPVSILRSDADAVTAFPLILIDDASSAHTVTCEDTVITSSLSDTQ